MGSPTGTTVVPRSGLNTNGYSVVDEVCGDTEDPNYLKRFETPMFRAVTVVDDIAYLLDGSLLWAVDLAQPKTPKRISLTRLPGHPLSIAVGSSGTLWIAAGESGLLEVDVSDPSAPAIRSTVALPWTALDVEWSNGHGYLALGSNGVGSFVLDEQGRAVLEPRLAIGSFVADVAIENNTLYAAACSQVVSVALLEGEPVMVRSRRTVPSGHGRHVTVANGIVYVSAGEALYAYGTTTDGQLRALGSYSDPKVPGFYVNQFVVLGDKGFIAAGDESVRVVELGTYARWTAEQQQNISQSPSRAAPDLDDPVDLSMPMPTAGVRYGDPIAVGLHGTSLLVLGNFRWVGERLLTILDATDPIGLPEIGSYGQPARYSDIDHVEGTNELRIQDSHGSKFLLTSGLELAQRWGFGLAKQWVTVGERLAYVSQDGALYCADGYAQMVHGAVGDSLVVVGDRFVVGTRDNNALASFDGVGCSASSMRSFAPGLGLISQARLGTSRGALLAYDWVLGILRVFQNSKKEPFVLTQSFDVGLCENYDWADLFSGAREIRARFVETSNGFALLCPSDENQAASLRNFVWNWAGSFDPDAVIALPDGRYSDVVATSNGWAAATFDNGRYLSELLFISDSGSVTERYAYNAHAKGLLRVDAAFIVFDSDHGPLRYDPQTNHLEQLALPSLEGDSL